MKYECNKKKLVVKSRTFFSFKTLWLVSGEEEAQWGERHKTNKSEDKEKE